MKGFNFNEVADFKWKIELLFRYFCTVTEPFFCRTSPSGCLCALLERKKMKEMKQCAFCCTQSDTLLWGIARFSREDKNKLRTLQPQKWKNLRTASLKQNLLVPIKKECTIKSLWYQSIINNLLNTSISDVLFNQ